MNDPAPCDHPSLEKLRTFGLGQLELEPGEASAVEEHVSHCQACCRTLAEVGPDTLVDLLRTARRKAAGVPGSETIAVPPAPAEPARDRPLSSETTTVGADHVPAVVGLPPELADHPRYRVLALLGTGGMGAVYKAEHRLMERLVALKVMAGGLVSSPAMIERFRREVKTAARLSHPNIVTAYDAEQAGELHFLVMEYVEGIDLARQVDERGPLPVAEACDYLCQAAAGLQHAHEHGMIHRDIKPHNLIVTQPASGGRKPPDEGDVATGGLRPPLARTVKILDFGLARLAGTAASMPGGTTAQGTLLGTVDYIAPEQADDASRADIRCDIYSLGCTLYHLLSGRPPFPHGTIVQKIMAHTERQPTPLLELRADLPPGLVRIVERMMAKSPAGRYQTPAEVRAALEPFTRPAAVAAPVQPLPRQPVAPAPRPAASGSIERVDPWNTYMKELSAPRLAAGERTERVHARPQSPRRDEVILDVLPVSPRRRRRWPLMWIALVLLALLLLLGGLSAAVLAVFSWLFH